MRQRCFVGDLLWNGATSILTTWRRIAQPAAEQCSDRLDGTFTGTRSFETKDRTEQASNPAESTADGRSGAMGSASPQDKAGHKPDDTPVTARPGFVQPGTTGFLLTIDSSALCPLGVEVRSHMTLSKKRRRAPSPASPVHYVDFESETPIDEVCTMTRMCRKGPMTW